MILLFGILKSLGNELQYLSFAFRNGHELGQLVAVMPSWLSKGKRVPRRYSLMALRHLDKIVASLRYVCVSCLSGAVRPPLELGDFNDDT
jgi:hypothetical protein